MPIGQFGSNKSQFSVVPDKIEPNHLIIYCAKNTKNSYAH